MSSKSEIIVDLNTMSDQISTQVRTISVVIIVLVWGGLIGESATLMALFSGSPRRMIAIGGIALLALVVDFFQYVVGYFLSWRLLRKLECSGENDVKYDYGSRIYRLRGYFFWAKQGFMLLSILMFGLSLAASLIPEK